jgi:hypothetical protein
MLVAERNPWRMKLLLVAEWSLVILYRPAARLQAPIPCTVRMQRKLILLIGFSTALRCYAAGLLELGNDEVYYWTYAQHLQWNYFDHPPGVAWLIRLGTFNLALQQEFFVRLGSIVCAGVNTWLVFIIGKKIRDERTGWYAALFFTASFYCSVIAGTFILPDSPQLLFWILSLWLMVQTVDLDAPSPQLNKRLAMLGLTIGLCILCKVHGLFLWAGYGAYIVFYQPRLLRARWLYLSVLLTALVISPILIWNWQNHFVTYTFHNSRVGFFGKHLDLDALLQQVLGSIFYNNPVNMTMYVLALVAVARKKIPLEPRYMRLLLLLGLPLIALLLLMSLFNDTLPHWSGPAYIAIMLLSADYFSTRFALTGKTPKGLRAANWVFALVVLIAVPLIRYLPRQIGDGRPERLGSGDVTLDMSGWKTFHGQFDSLYRRDSREGRMHQAAYILSDRWFPAGHLDYYLARPDSITLLVLGQINDIHQYAWRNQDRPPLRPGQDAYFIYPSNYYDPPHADLRNYFRLVEDSLVFTQYRGGNTAVRNFVVYRLHGYQGGLPRDGLLP